MRLLILMFVLFSLIPSSPAVDHVSRIGSGSKTLSFAHQCVISHPGVCLCLCLCSSIVKDTKEMEQYKGEIESKMEFFKELEREVKTKSYEGGAHAREDREQSFDPEADPALTELVEWLKETLDTLDEQVCHSICVSF